MLRKQRRRKLRDLRLQRDFLLHQIQAVFGAASVRLTRHHRHNVRGRYFCFDAIK
jgi:hypothetical protein